LAIRQEFQGHGQSEGHAGQTRKRRSGQYHIAKIVIVGRLKGMTMHRWMLQLGLTLAWLACGLIGVARADVLLDETILVAAPGVAQGSEFSFTATTAQALTVTLNDDQTPAAFQSLQIAVTLGDTLVGMASVD